ncbi:homoprotocatechuate degradation operon regulator HpaR [Sulfitobacter sp. D35]|uniref:homoprotocatechuate degradation operon regulator HpaR n=1 Tax=Sulfitobacter sp. D35 TaxID=3083252 RepID=UPI00296F4C1C|nr:homoprotocatechuate degradation operon regulator HpaR [Sulfitobacter sp. D35]MDW4496958.1 homoprotocatechuate degradation operon regulator HpaR [Sulfitobacter sp. D35]
MVKQPRVVHRRASALPIALLRAREAVSAPLRDMLQDSGLSEQKWRVLRVLEDCGPMEQTALARGAGLLLSSLTRILNALEHEGLVARESVPHDRRRTVAKLTDQGLETLARHAARSAAIFSEIEARFGAERIEELLDMLEALAEPS